jgi:zinc and cadmium transporter
MHKIYMFQFLELLSLAIFASFVGLVGAIVFLYNRKLSEKLSHNAIPFASGVLITVSLIGLLPEAVDMIGESAFLIVLIAFFCAYFFEHFLLSIHHHEDDHHGRDYRSAAWFVIVGDTIHNFIDGVTIGATYIINPGLGIVSTVSTFLHEIPHEIGDFGILLAAGWKRKDILLVNLLSASVTIFGAFSVYLFVQNTGLIGAMLAVSAGIFLYLGSIDFLPNIFNDHKKGGLTPIIPLLLGILIMALTLRAIPHEHTEDQETKDVQYVGSQEMTQ